MWSCVLECQLALSAHVGTCVVYVGMSQDLANYILMNIPARTLNHWVLW